MMDAAKPEQTTANDPGTGSEIDTQLTSERSADVPHRYRLIDQHGKAYAPFRVKPGSLLAAVLAQAGFDDNDYRLERVS